MSERDTTRTATRRTVLEATVAGPCAVGGGGLVIERTDEGWRTVLDGGPTGNGNDACGADVTDDGERLWFVGASGAIGEYDVETGNLEDHSAPMDVTNNFYRVDADGPDDVWVSGGGGMVFHWNGSEWTPADTGDASLRDVEVAGDDGLAVGGGGAVYAYDGREWTAETTPRGENLKGVVRGDTATAVGAAGTVLER